MYTFNEHWALTLGGRWARDQLDGEENAGFYNEDTIAPLGFARRRRRVVASRRVNQAFGYLGAGRHDPESATPTGRIGVPTASACGVQEERKDDDITWRVNLDFTPTDNDLIYLSATKGSRAGGFNLVFFSAERDSSRPRA